MKLINQTSLILVILFLIFSCATNRLTGNVIKVQDGDTVSILTGKKEKIKIRLYGIDAPETGQDFNQKSKKYLSDLVAGKDVTIVNMGKDQYNRVLGVVYVGKLNVNEEMLRSGLAWRYKYSNDSRYLELQEEAERKQLNIWSMKNPVDPWQWRKDRRRKK